MGAAKMVKIKNIPRHVKLLIALVAGVLFGVIAHPFADEPTISFLANHLISPIGQIFLRLIFMVVVPLIFSALVLGVFELWQHHGLGRVIRKTMLYTLIASTTSVLIGISLVNLLEPGVGVASKMQLSQQSSSLAESVTSIQQNAQSAKPFSQVLVELIPKNPFESAVKAMSGEILSLMFFALIFGVALSMIVRESDGKNPLIALLEQIYAVCMKIIDFAMQLAPFGVFALVFTTVLKAGYSILVSLMFYVLVVVIGLLIQQFLVYGALLKVVAKRSPLKFFKDCREVYLYAFSTASSNATLPTSLEVAEKKLMLPKRISRFVLTVGATANQNGTALFEGVTVLFLAQVYGINLSMVQQVQVVLMSILAGVGTAGVPGGSLPLVMIVMQSVGIPAEGIGIVLGVDRFLDMCRTTINVSGDLVITALVSGDDNEHS